MEAGYLLVSIARKAIDNKPDRSLFVLQQHAFIPEPLSSLNSVPVAR